VKVTETGLPGVVTIEPRVFGDHRGFFLEVFRESAYADFIDPDLRFVQDNHSHSRRGVLRGLHCQVARPQGKLVHCVRGEIFDVVVDIDAASPTFGQWVGVHLSERQPCQIYVPPGYVHGFQVISEQADVLYKCTDYYDPAGESGLIWNDPEVGVEWPIAQPDLSERDAALPGLAHWREASGQG